MKKLIFITLTLLAVTGSYAQKKSGYTHMTPSLWEQDIDYLNKKIQKQFQSFFPGVKEAFGEGIVQLKSQLESLQNHEVAAEIMRLLSTLKDGHTELNIGHARVGFHRVPLSLYFFEDELYVLATHKGYESLLGNRIVAIGDVPLAEAFQKLKNNMSRDNEMEYLHAGPGYIVLTELLSYLGITNSPNSATFSFESADGKISNKSFKGLNRDKYNEGPWVTLRQVKGVETPLYQSQQSKSYWFSYLEDEKTMYFNFSRTNNQKGAASIKSFSKTLFAEIDRVKPEKLVIDLRLNSGGNYNLTRPIVEAIKAREWLNQKDKVWAITSRRTFSAAATMCIFLKQETQAQIIGEVSRTHPNQADNNEYMSLPNSNFLIEYTTKIKVHWPERPELDRIPVDVAIIPTLDAYSSGSDSVLEYLFKH